MNVGPNFIIVSHSFCGVKSLIKALFSEVNPIPVKAALNLAGYNFGMPRLPLTPMSDEKLKVLKEEMLKFS